MASLPRRPDVFKLERFFAQHEFSTKHLLCASDSEPITVKELLSLADEECKALWDNLSLAYTNTRGHPLLRQEITKMYRHVTEEDLLVLVPNEGIFIAMHCVADYIRRLEMLWNKMKKKCYISYHCYYSELNCCEEPFWQRQRGNS